MAKKKVYVNLVSSLKIKGASARRKKIGLLQGNFFSKEFFFDLFRVPVVSTKISNFNNLKKLGRLKLELGNFKKLKFSHIRGLSQK